MGPGGLNLAIHIHLSLRTSPTSGPPSLLIIWQIQLIYGGTKHWIPTLTYVTLKLTCDCTWWGGWWHTSSLPLARAGASTCLGCRRRATLLYKCTLCSSTVPTDCTTSVRQREIHYYIVITSLLHIITVIMTHYWPPQLGDVERHWLRIQGRGTYWACNLFTGKFVLPLNKISWFQGGMKTLNVEYFATVHSAVYTTTLLPFLYVVERLLLSLKFSAVICSSTG